MIRSNSTVAPGEPAAAIGVIDTGVFDQSPRLHLSVFDQSATGIALPGAHIAGHGLPAASRTGPRPAVNDNRSSARRFDQYYTRLDVAALCVRLVKRHYRLKRFQVVEPTAGDGAFLRILPRGSIGYDIDPRYPGIIHRDFLTVTVGGERPRMFIGNPPFGTRSAKAIAIFNHAAREANVIAMILPSTFLKGWAQNRLNRNFRLVRTWTVPAKAFRFEGHLVTIPATFMIWERRKERRELWPTATTHPDFDFLETGEGADFGIQRVGGAAGEVHHDLSKSPSSHLFVAARRDGVEAIMRQLPLKAFAARVAGCPSIAKSEIVALYTAWVARHSEAEV